MDPFWTEIAKAGISAVVLAVGVVALWLERKSDQAERTAEHKAERLACEERYKALREKYDELVQEGNETIKSLAVALDRVARERGDS